LVVGVDVLKRDGGELRRELCGHPDREGHSPFELWICCGAVLILIILIASLNINL
jgi:hypothetical protein